MRHIEDAHYAATVVPRPFILIFTHKAVCLARLLDNLPFNQPYGRRYDYYSFVAIIVVKLYGKESHFFFLLLIQSPLQADCLLQSLYFGDAWLNFELFAVTVDEKECRKVDMLYTYCVHIFVNSEIFRCRLIRFLKNLIKVKYTLL